MYVRVSNSTFLIIGRNLMFNLSLYINCRLISLKILHQTRNIISHFELIFNVSNAKEITMKFYKIMQNLLQKYITVVKMYNILNFVLF